MSNKSLFSLAFIIGTVTGSIVTWYLLKDKYEALAQEEIDSVKEVFSRREQELKDQSVKKTVAEGIKDADKEKPADENDEVIEDVEDAVGIDSLNHFGEYEDDSVFVRNDARKCDYEILLDQRTYSEVVEDMPHQMEV